MQILPKEDADAGQIVLESLLKDGVAFVFNCKFVRIEHTPATGDQVTY
jgi:Pyridine nucleotide-disulphide oxidoreductase